MNLYVYMQQYYKLPGCFMIEARTYAADGVDRGPPETVVISRYVRRQRVFTLDKRGLTFNTVIYSHVCPYLNVSAPPAPSQSKSNVESFTYMSEIKHNVNLSHPIFILFRLSYTEATRLPCSIRSQ